MSSNAVLGWRTEAKFSENHLCFASFSLRKNPCSQNPGTHSLCNHMNSATPRWLLQSKFESGFALSLNVMQFQKFSIRGQEFRLANSMRNAWICFSHCRLKSASKINVTCIAITQLLSILRYFRGARSGMACFRILQFFGGQIPRVREIREKSQERDFGENLLLPKSHALKSELKPTDIKRQHEIATCASYPLPSAPTLRARLPGGRGRR